MEIEKIWERNEKNERTARLLEDCLSMVLRTNTKLECEIEELKKENAQLKKENAKLLHMKKEYGPESCTQLRRKIDDLEKKAEVHRDNYAFRLEQIRELRQEITKLTSESYDADFSHVHQEE